MSHTYEGDLSEQDIVFEAEITEFDAEQDSGWEGEGIDTMAGGSRFISEMMENDPDPY